MLMKESIKMFSAVLLSIPFLWGCGGNNSLSEDNDNKPDVEAKVDFTVDVSNVITKNFLGIGTQYNSYLFKTNTMTEDGVSEANYPELEKKVVELGSQYVRIFFSNKCWPDKKEYHPENWPSFLRVVQLAQKSKSLVNITYWHTSRTEDMSRFADVIKTLIVDEGLTCVKQVTIQNEVNGSTKFTPEYYHELYTEFVGRLTELGIRDKIQIVGGDLTKDHQDVWFSYLSTKMAGILDGYSSHIYYDYWDAAKPIERLNSIRKELDKMQGIGIKPCYITEYGIRGKKNGTDDSDPGFWQDTNIQYGTTTDCAFRHAKFQMQAMNAGFAGLIKWDCFKAKYANGNQYYSVIGAGKDGYPITPTYWMLWTFTHTSKIGWQVIATERINASNDKDCAIITDGQGNFTVYAGSKVAGVAPFVIVGLPANKKFRVISWNSDRKGGLTEMESVTSDASGKLIFKVDPECLVAVTTLDFTIPKDFK